MPVALTAIGLVFVLEGLAFALAPNRLDQLLEFLRELPRDRRRALGLLAIATGTMLIWLARALTT